MFLLDTNVLSELRRGKNADGQVRGWAQGIPVENFFLSAITILEIEWGALSVMRKDAMQGAALRAWIDRQILPQFSGRVLAVDTAVALKCAALHVPDRRSERDALIAATAAVHGLQVVTRNVNDFASTGISLVNPWL